METLFGRTYDHIGSTDSDFIIKTRGQVKIQWGKVFIDLIKDGKINVNSDIFNIVDTVNDVKGADGIYYVKEDGSVYILIDGNVINIAGELGTTYVSFKEPQETTGDEKYTALANIGFIYKTLKEAQASGIPNSILYVEETGLLYYIRNGELIEFTTSIPNPYTEQFVVSKVDRSSEGAIVIQGSGKENSLIVGNMYLYQDEQRSIIYSPNSIVLNAGNTDVVEVTPQKMKVNYPANFKREVTSNMFMSPGATEKLGFRLYLERGESTLEVDNIVVRKGIPGYIETTHKELLQLIEDRGLGLLQKYCIMDFQNEWELTTEDDTVENEGEVEDEDSDDSEESTEAYNTRPIIVTAAGPDSITRTGYFRDKPEWIIEYDINYQDKILVPTMDEDGAITRTPVEAKGRITKLTDENGNSCNYDFKHLTFLINDNLYYTFGGTTDLSSTDSFKNVRLNLTNPARHGNNGIDSISVNKGNNIVLSGTYNNVQLGTINNSFTFDGTMSNVKVIGSLSNVIFDKNSGSTVVNNCMIDNLSGITFRGPLEYCTFHNTLSGYDFTKEKYPLLYDSSKVKDIYLNNSKVNIICIPDIVFPGMIVMYNGQAPIPTGWHICDGTGGTPNLVGSFIKAGISAGETGGKEEIELKIENLPPHTHKFSQSSVTTSESGEHSHIYRAPVPGDSDNANDRTVQTGSTDALTSPAGNHTHTIDLSSAALEEVGEGVPLKWEPKYYSLIFIMKVDAM